MTIAVIMFSHIVAWRVPTWIWGPVPSNLGKRPCRWDAISSQGMTVASSFGAFLSGQMPEMAAVNQQVTPPNQQDSSLEIKETRQQPRQCLRAKQHCEEG